MILPDNLFYDISDSSPVYRSSSCIDNNHIKVATRVFVDSNSGTNTLFVKVYGEIGCQISIFNENSFCQTSEIKVNIIVLK